MILFNNRWLFTFPVFFTKNSLGMPHYSTLSVTQEVIEHALPRISHSFTRLTTKTPSASTVCTNLGVPHNKILVHIWAVFLCGRPWHKWITALCKADSRGTSDENHGPQPGSEWLTQTGSAKRADNLCSNMACHQLTTGSHRKEEKIWKNISDTSFVEKVGLEQGLKMWMQSWAHGML